jgi:uncharacterized protein YjbJ (UPF0337 family)
MEVSMEEIKKKIENVKEKVVGQGKETIGKVTGNHELELKGKMQAAKVDIMENVEDSIHDIRQGVAEKINNVIDKIDNNKS